MTDLPKTHRALVLTSTSSPLEIRTLPVPLPGPGSITVRILFTNVISYMKHVYNGTRAYPFPTPFIPGVSAIARIAAVGPDATSLRPGQLVLVGGVVRGRDDQSAAFLIGIHEGFSEGSKALMHGEWRNGTFAEYARIPLENAHVLNEERLLGKLGYQPEDLVDLSRLLVPYGGLSDVALKPGETVIIAPATGPFGMAAVKVALAMGARVIAMGRNVEALERLARKYNRVDIVPITGDMAKDSEALKEVGPIDVYFDISPPVAASSTHFKSAILALRHGGRVSLMGGLQGDLAIPHSIVMHKDLSLRGKWMYDQKDIPNLFKLAEIGSLKLGDERIAGRYGLDEWEEAFDKADACTGTADYVVIQPGKRQS